WTKGLAWGSAFGVIHGGFGAGAIGYLWCGTHAEPRGDPCVGYLDRPYRRGTPARARNRQGGRTGLSREGMRGMPWGDGYRGQSAHFEKQSWPGWLGCRHLGTGTNTAASLAVRDHGLGLHQSRHAPP